MSAFAENGKVFLTLEFEVFADEPALAIKSLPPNGFSGQADSPALRAALLCLQPGPAADLGVLIREASARPLKNPARKGAAAVSCLCEIACPGAMRLIAEASALLWNCEPEDLAEVCCEDLAFEALAVLNGLPSPSDLGYSFGRAPSELSPASCSGRGLLDCLFESAKLSQACPADPAKKHGGISL